MKKGSEEIMLKRQVQMTDDKMLLLKHKNELSINHLKVKHVKSEVSQDNVAKCGKIDVEQRRAEHEYKKTRTAFTIDYYVSNIVSILIVLLKLLKFCKMSKICPLIYLVVTINRPIK